jgi:ubiquinone/menaquinone biosynthesis C-methylase UbiE
MWITRIERVRVRELSKAMKSFKFKLREWFIVYPKAYTNCILWPLALAGRRTTFKEMAATAAQFLAKGRVLDVGTGPGHLPVEIARTCPNLEVVGVDISVDLLHDGIEKGKKRQAKTRTTFIQAQAEFLPFSDNSFDIVYSMFSLHLWTDRQQGISEIRRVLVSEGKALILVGRQRLLKGFDLMTDFLTRKSIKNMEISCLNAGFKRVEITERRGKLRVELIK